MNAQVVWTCSAIAKIGQQYWFIKLMVNDFKEKMADEMQCD